jgi:hypothetical protein
VISLRKRAGAGHWLRIDDAPQPVGPCGPSVERGFAAADSLATHDDEALPGARLRPAPEVVWEQRLTPAAGGWQADRHQLYLRTELAYRGEVDPRCVALVGRCRGGETVRQALEGLNEPGRPPLDPGAALALVRGLIEQGFLLPA